MELVELIRGAQDAMDRGDYAVAAAACAHALDTYPNCFTAHRMLAEAYLEQGQIDAAIGHFERTLAIDPLNVLARLGRGVAAEEKREMSDAYASYLHAWEINPALDQVRDELVRLRGLLGGGERLHPTRPGLAGIFTRGGQFGRAAAEWRAVLMVEPENLGARTALAEVLWRSGDDVSAAGMCREALEVLPENARALAMLAEIEQRRGSTSTAELVERYQVVDPLAEIAMLLSEWRDGVDVGFLAYESASLPDFDPNTASVPDPEPAMSSAPGNAPSGLAGGQFAAPDLWDTLIRDFPGDSQAPGGSVPFEADVQPFSWLDEGSTAPPPAADPYSLDALIEQHASGSEDIPADLMEPKRRPSTDRLSLEDEIAAFAPDTAPFTPEEAAPPPKTEPVPAMAAVPEPIVEPKPAATPPAAANPFVTADGRVDLTVGWDDLDRELQAATPNFANSAEMDALAAQLGVDGIAPFEMDAAPFDESAWEPFTADDMTDTSAPPAAQAPEEPRESFAPPAPSMPFEADELVADAPAGEDDSVDLGWELDDELLSSIPQPRSSGYTEMLRHVDTELPQEVEVGPEFDPLANPDSAGVPLAFEDLLAVTSRDGTAPLRTPGQLPDEEPLLAALEDDESPALQAHDQVVDSNDESAGQPLDENLLGLEDLLRDDANAVNDADLAWESHSEPGNTATTGEEPSSQQQDMVLDQSPEVDFDVNFEGLGDLEPFRVDDTTVEPARLDAEIDFSDIDELPFDLGEVADAVNPAASEVFEPEHVASTDEDEFLKSSATEPADSDQAMASEVNVDDGAGAWEDALGEAGEPEQEHVAAGLTREHLSVGLGIQPGSVGWPAFVNHTSELIDRSLSGGNLFARLRDAKRGAVSAGLLEIDRSVRDLRRPGDSAALAAEQVQVYGAPGAEASPASSNGATTPGSMTESDRIDLMAMRVQLIEDVSSAAEVAERLEGAVMHGLNDPLALRVLGEAYLKLGRTEQAAAQFRQAMLARRRAR